jgi:hypothetical protein
MLICLSLSVPRRNYPMGSALECVAEEFHRIGANRLRDRDEFGHIHPPLERFDALNPVRRLPQLLRKLSLREPGRFARPTEGGNDGPLTGRIFHDTPGRFTEVLLIPYHPY